MAPAYWILKERRADILKATTLEQVIDLYMSGCALTYNPNWIVNDLNSLIKEIFVTNKNSSLLSKIMNTQQLNRRAIELEETRKKYEEDLSLIFNSIEEENKAI